MAAPNTVHEHPMDRRETVFGRRLGPEENAEESDVYNATSGKWLPVPSIRAGESLGRFPGLIIIRPAR